MKRSDRVTKVQEVRKRNLRALRDNGAFSPTIFKALGWKAGPSTISQYAGRHRAVGESIARDIEGALGLPRGALDREAPDEAVVRPAGAPMALPGAPSLSVYEACMRELFGALARVPGKAPEDLLPDAIVLLTKLARGNEGTVDRGDAERVAKLLAR